MKLGLARGQPPAVFVTPIREDDRPIFIDGWQRPDRMRPRWARAFPTQAQVAAWAQGREESAAGPDYMGRTLLREMQGRASVLRG
jgi:hypothetical protein